MSKVTRLTNSRRGISTQAAGARNKTLSHHKWVAGQNPTKFYSILKPLPLSFSSICLIGLAMLKVCVSLSVLELGMFELPKHK